MKATFEIDQNLIIWIHLEDENGEQHCIPPICLNTKEMREDFPHAAFINQVGFDRLTDFVKELFNHD
jgi:hypothetical protein